MKKFLVSVAVVAILAGWLGKSWSQTQPAATRPAATVPVTTKIGLIDLAQVFEKYDKFKAMREDLTTEIEGMSTQAKGMAATITKIKNEMKNFKSGSPEFVERENEITKLVAELKAFDETSRKDFFRKESQIYRTVYLEVIDVVKLYAEHYKYSLVLRFNGQFEDDKLDTSNPQALIQGLNRQVVFHRTEDDITSPVIEYLNRNYTKSASKATGTKARTN